MRPKLKSDTFFLPVHDGVYIRNNEKSFVMKGKTINAWIERLAPLLDGNYDLERIYQNAPQEKQVMIAQIIQTLAEQGYVKDVAQDQPHSLSPELQETYNHAIAYIDYYTDSGPYRFQKFLHLPVLAIGSGEPLVAMAHALLESGNQCISLLDSGEMMTDNERIQEHLSILQAERDPTLTLRRISFNQWHDDEQLQALLAPFSMVLLFSTNGSLALIHPLTRICSRMALPFLPAIVLDDALHIGPMHLPHTQGCWHCYWRRRQAARGVVADDERGTLLLPTPDKHLTEPGFPAIAIAANLLAFEFFKQGTGVHTATLENEVYTLELEHLQSVRHRVFPHPLCTTCVRLPSSLSEGNSEQWAERVCKDVAQLQQHDTILTPQKILEYTDQWIDETCGIFTKIDERDYFQLPFIRSKVTIASPRVENEKLSEREAIGLDYLETRALAAREAATFYLDRVVVPRQACYISTKDVEHLDIPPLSTFSGWIGESVPDQQQLPYQWGRWLDEDRPVLVPMAAVHPRSFWNQHQGKQLFRAATPGIVAGASWFETLARGMLSLVGVLDNAAGDGTVLARSTHAHILSKYAYGDEITCKSYLKMIDILDHHIELLHLESVTGLVRIGTLLDDHCIGIRSHWNAMAAIRKSLQDALLTLQIERSAGPAEREQKGQSGQPASGFDTGLIIDKQERKILPPSLAAETHYQQAVQILEKCFRNHGWRLIVVPTVKDSTISEVLGCTMHILAVQWGDR